jgi:Nuclear pore complex scaffold, nucleoporins 186/192/205
LAASQATSQQFIISPKTVLLALSFLRVLSTVVTHSVAVRTRICGHAHFRAIPTLLSPIPLEILFKLKGAIFEALAAFCKPGAGAAGVEICKAVWTLMERQEVVNVRMWPSTGVSMATGKGMEVELDQIESAHKSYLATIPFLKLLSALITQIISTESMEDITLAEEFAEQSTGAGAPNMDSEAGSLEQANRLAASDLLIQDTELNRPFPNIAHFLLFGGRVGNQTIQDPHALGARQTSIHVLLELVNAGIPRLRGKRK